MCLLRRATLAVLVLLLALTACRKREGGPEEAGREGREGGPARIETEAVAGDLPAGAAVVVSIHDLQGYWTRLKATQLFTQIRAIPEVDSILNPTKNPQLAGAMQEFQTRIGMPLNEQTLFTLFGKKVQIGAYPAASDTADPRLVVVADMSDKDALASALSKLRTEAETRGVTYATEQYKGVELTVVSESGGGVHGLYGFHKEKLVASTDQAGMQAAVDALDDGGQTMSSDTLYQRALAHVGPANITVFADKRGTRGLMGAMQRASQAAGEPAPADVDSMLDVVERFGVQRATIFGSHWTDEGVVLRSYTILDPAASGASALIGMLQTPASTVEVMNYFPDSTLGFYAVNFLDASAIYDWFVSYAKEISRAGAAAGAGQDPGAQIDAGIAQFEQASGMSIPTDILGWMGKEAAIGLNGVVKGGFFPVPELSLAVQSTDTVKAKAFFDKLEVKLVEGMQSSPQGFPLQFQEEDYKGVKIRYAPTPMGEGLAPGYALHEDFALIALSRNTLKRMLDAKTGAVPTVSANPQFKSLSGFYPGEANIVGFANTAQLVTEVSSVMTTFQQMSGQAPGGPAQDAMTRGLEALKNLQAVAAYGVNDAGGLDQRFLIKIQ